MKSTKRAAAASSHTGSLAGNDNVADALLKKCGVIRAENLEDAFLLASSMTKMPRLRGNRVGIISNAGGLGTLTTDALVKYGFELPELSSEERAELAAKLLPEASTHNPLDLVAPAPPAHYAIAAHAMIDSGKYDAIIVDCVPPATIDTGEVAQAMVDILKSTSIPIFSCFFGPTLGAAGRAVMKKGGIPTFSFPDQMVRTMRYMVQPEEAACDIPICDDEYFDDDITGRFVEFVRKVYGDDTLEENLKFVADALGGKGTPKEVIRNYFLNDFYADHCKIYQKRPIYWLFDSGKKNGFKALIYMHRYKPDIIARMRTDYVHEQQSRYRTAIADLENRIANADTGSRVKLTKQLTKLQNQAEELRVYEEKIHHLADQMIRIDLDDGVKHNYEIFKDVLAKMK